MHKETLKETYERLNISITKFDTEDVITTSDITNPPAFDDDQFEIPLGF